MTAPLQHPTVSPYLKFKINLYKYPIIYVLCFSCLLIMLRIFLCDPKLSYDEAEQINLAQSILPGYPAQPPLYTWLQWCTFKICGVNLLSLSLVKFLLICGNISAYHFLCRYYCQNDDLLAWAATLSWALIPNIGYDFLPHRSHVILALLTSILTWQWFINLQKNPVRIYSYLHLGVLIGLGLLTKFNYLLFLSITLLSAVSIKEYRDKLLTRYIIISFALAFLLASPYLIWLIYNTKLGLAAYYKLRLGKSYLHGIFDLFSTMLSFCIPLILIYCFFFLTKAPIYKATANIAYKLLWRYHLFLVPVILFFMLVTGTNHIQRHWLVPLLFLLPLSLFSIIKHKNYIKRNARYYILLCLTVQIILLIIWVFHTQINKWLLFNSYCTFCY